MTEKELISMCNAGRSVLAALASPEARDKILAAIPGALLAAREHILSANARDLLLRVIRDCRRQCLIG